MNDKYYTIAIADDSAFTRKMVTRCLDGTEFTVIAEAGDGEQAFECFRDYRPDVTILLELMTDLDEGLQEWRYRHVKMVERTIGNKRGTGGSGLGLAVSKGLIEDHGGSIAVHSIRGKYTEFVILLPVAPPSPQD